MDKEASMETLKKIRNLSLLIFVMCMALLLHRLYRSSNEILLESSIQNYTAIGTIALISFVIFARQVNKNSKIEEGIQVEKNNQPDPTDIIPFFSRDNVIATLDHFFSTLWKTPGELEYAQLYKKLRKTLLELVIVLSVAFIIMIIFTFWPSS